MPLNMDNVFTRTMDHINRDKQAYDDRYLILSKDVSPFKCDHYFLVKGNVDGYETHKIEGQFYTKVYDGDFKEISSWIKDFEKHMKTRKQPLKEMFVFYTTCPNCAKVYGHNYVVLFGKLDE